MSRIPLRQFASRVSPRSIVRGLAVHFLSRVSLALLDPVTGKSARATTLISQMMATMLLTLAGVLPNSLGSDEASPQFDATSIDFFEREVRPLLVKRCYECHSAKVDEPKGGLRLDSRAAVLKGGDSGIAIKPGKPAESLLIDAINYGDLYEMPPKSKLSAAEIATLTKWVKMGAPWPKEETVSSDTRKEFDLDARKKEHWCWQPIRSKDPPTVKANSWPQQPLDHFVLRRLEKSGLAPNSKADRRSLIRRAYFDVIGLPPTPKQVTDFLHDTSPEAFETVVDNLLRSPHFGERWARHWMDLVRYAETYGHEFDYQIPYPTAYRDYLIRAFNADLPYDQFLIEQVAGDLLAKPRLHPTEGYNESVIGTGFWQLGEATHAPVDVLGDEAGRLDNQIDVFSKTFLGVTLACARCHDHKFDAISTKDYYALAGMLRSSRRQEAILDPRGLIGKASDQLTALRDEGDAAIRNCVRNSSLQHPGRFSRFLLASREVLYGESRQVSNVDRSDVLFADFEADDYGQWKIDGTAFGASPQTQETTPKYQGELGAKGRRWVNSHNVRDGADVRGGDGHTGTLTSPRFTIQHRSIRFLVGGGAHQGKTCVNLLIEGKVVRTQTGRNSNLMFQAAFDVAEFNGRAAKIQVVDREQGGWGNIGIDHVVFTNKGGKAPQRRPVKEVAAEFDLDVESLSRWVAALSNKESKLASHPMRSWLELASNDLKAEMSEVESLRNRLAHEQRMAADSAKSSELFADFNGKGFEGWFATGHAFGIAPTANATWDGMKGGMTVAESGVAHSGLLSKRMQGVLRSPTFTIKNRNILYRIAGSNAQVRLIVDGYFMDVYNGLLFRGFKFDVNSGDEFRWHTQSQDVGRYIGHRAHIEIIDHGDGFVALDEIRFSDNGPPRSGPNSIAQGVLSANEVGSLESLAKAYEKNWLEASKNWARGSATGDESAFVNWVVNHGLLPQDDKTQKTFAELTKSFAEKSSKVPAPTRVLAMADGTGQNSNIYVRGNHRTAGEVATRGILTAIGPFPKMTAGDGSGRLVMARLMTEPTNPLTSRVAVNRVWHHLFGRGIVASTDNFGSLGETPTHPQLLDHLAMEFMKNGWSLKQLIRTIMLSSTYQMSSVPNVEGSNVDPQNLLLYRARVRRLQGEAIRDAILHVSGRLDRKQFGPSVPVHLTAFMQGRGRPRGSGPLDGHGRRSIYTSVRRNFLPSMMLAFDTPIPFSSVGRRNVSNVPAQALILMNDPFVVQQSQIWSKRLLTEEATSEQRVKRMYEAAFARIPEGQEIEDAIAFLDQQGRELGLDSDAARSDQRVWADLCHVILNVKEFIFIK